MGTEKSPSGASALVDVVARVAGLLKEGSVASEKQVEYMVFVPIMRVLGWDPHGAEPNLRPEFTVQSRRVDFACVVGQKPRAFAELKEPGADLRNHEEQLLDYCFKAGVSIAVLTNGGQWFIYLPREEGPWQERKVAEIDVTGDPNVASGLLWKYLSRENIESGRAVELASKDLREEKRIEGLLSRLPGALRSVLSEPPEYVVAALLRALQEKQNLEPPPEMLADMLGGMLFEPPPAPVPPPRPRREKRAASRRVRRRGGATGKLTGKKPRRMTLDGRPVEVGNWSEVLANTANWLIAKGAKLPVDEVLGTKRRLISRDRRKLRTPKPLDDGTWIEVHWNAENCVERAERLLEAAGYDRSILRVEAE